MSVAVGIQESRTRSPSIPRSPSPAVHERERSESRAAFVERLGEARTPGERRTGQQTATAYDAAFAEAYEKYYAKIFAYVYARVDEVDLAQDITAETFEKAYKKGHSLRRLDAYTSWLFTIAKNEVTGYYRRRQREFDGVNLVKESLALADRPESPEFRVIENERFGSLMRHVRTLSTREQEILSLRYDAELSSSEISQVMGMSAVGVRVNIYRALARLRKRMEEEQD